MTEIVGLVPTLIFVMIAIVSILMVFTFRHWSP